MISLQRDNHPGGGFEPIGAVRRRAPTSTGLTGQDVGRNRGGPTTKIHVAADRHGLRSTPGQQAGRAPKLLADLEAGATVIADKAYDTDAPAHRRSRGGCGDAFQGQPKEATPTGPRRRAQRRGAFFLSMSSGASPRAMTNSRATFYTCLTVIRYFLKAKNLIKSKA